MSHSASIAYKDLMQEVLKPATQVRFIEETNLGYLSLGSPDNVDTVLMRGFRTPTVPNYRRYATLDNFGWKVDDDSYACASSGNTTGNNCFITKELTANTDTAIQDNIGTSGIQGEIYLKIAPIQCSSITIKFGKTDHHGGFIDTPQEVTIDGTSMTDFETVSFTVEEDIYLLMFNVSEACRISYYPLSTNVADPAPIFDNSNILSVEVEEYADLYSQELPRFTVTAKIYDAEGIYDPINPQGEFAKFVQGYSVYMGLGYEVNGYLETPFWVVLYLNDTPQYDNNEITLTFTTAQSGDNKYVNTLPIIAGNAGDLVSNKTYYGINTVVSINSSGYDSLITLAEISQIVYSIYGNGFVNLPRPMYSSRVVYRSGTPKRFTDYDIVDKNSIKIDRKPVLKALTIKQYTNTIPSTYQDTISGSASNSNYVRWSTTNVRPFRMLINIDADISDICRVDELSLSGATNMAWGINNYTDPDSGATTLQFWVYCASYNAAGTTTYTLGLSHVRQVVNDITESVNADGENMVIDNPFVTDSGLLQSCADLVKQVSYYRDYYTFDAIADYLTDVGDWIVIDTPYEKGVPLFVTDIKYKMPGGICTITGNRRFSVAASDYSTNVTRFVYINGVEYIGFVDFALVGYFHTTGGNTDVVLVSASNGINQARVRNSTGYDTVNDGNVITIKDSTSLTWYCDVADHSTPGIYYPDGCMYLGTFANVEAAARYLITKAYADQGYTVTLGV